MKTRTVMQLVTAEKQALGPGQSVMVPFPNRKLQYVDPFVLFHHMLPSYQQPGSAMRIPPHPHKGFETVTLLLDGELEHYDSHGGHGIIEEGGVQWMTAGSGVLHSEGPSAAMQQQGGNLQLVQLWVNLPKAHKLTAPKYQDLKAADIPVVTRGHLSVRIVAGSFDGVKGPADTFTPMNVLHIRAAEKGTIILPVDKGYHALAYTLNGRAYSGEESFVKCQMVVFNDDGEQLQLTLEKGAEVLVLAGEPINEKIVAYGPFVMNSIKEIEEAYEEYRTEQFGTLEY
jgi:redox-sensitive bicupin YhaK (pirin superfamily)